MNINKLKLLLSAIVCVTNINSINANPNNSSNSVCDLNTNLHLSNIVTNNS